MRDVENAPTRTWNHHQAAISSLPSTHFHSLHHDKHLCLPAATVEPLEQACTNETRITMSLIGNSSMHALPGALRILSALRLNKSKPSQSKATDSELPGWLELAGISVCFVTALAINVALVFGLLRLIAPQLPLACLIIFGEGFVLLQFIDHLEEKQELAWRVVMDEKAAEAMETDQTDSQF